MEKPVEGVTEKGLEDFARELGHDRKKIEMMGKQMKLFSNMTDLKPIHFSVAGESENVDDGNCEDEGETFNTYSYATGFKNGGIRTFYKNRISKIKLV